MQIVLLFSEKEVHSGEIHALKQWFLSFTVCIRITWELFKTQVAEPNSTSVWSSGLEVVWDFAFLTNSQVRSMLLVYGPLFENFCLEETRQETCWNLIKIIKSFWKVVLASFNFLFVFVFLVCTFIFCLWKYKIKKCHDWQQILNESLMWTRECFRSRECWERGRPRSRPLKLCLVRQWKRVS